MDELLGFGLATLMASRGTDRGAVAAALGVALPTGPTCVAGDHLRLIGTGPGGWLAWADQAAEDWFTQLERLVGDHVSLSDQSSGYVVFRLVGPGARTLLQRGAAIDFDPAAFAPGAVAVTMIAHIGVIIWQIDAAPSYHVALFRSFAGSFRHWLDEATAAL